METIAWHLREELYTTGKFRSVPLALAIIHETTTAAIESYFPEKNNSADFLRLLNIWCIISKTQFLPINPLGNAANIGNNKPEFLKSFA